MIEIGKLSFAYGQKAVLREASFQVNNGRLYGIFGESGSGKSTLSALLAGALLPCGGFVHINGFDTVRNANSARRCVGYAPQAPAFYKHMTVYEFLSFAAEAKGVSADKRFLHVHEIMEKTELDEVADRLIGNLIPPLAARLNLAQAMLASPEILILDEITKGLSALEGRALRELIRALAQKGKTVFYASSNPREIASVSDEILLLQDGTLLPAAPISELLTGSYIHLTATGSAKDIEETLAASGQIASCRKLPTTEDKHLYRLKTARDNTSCEALTDTLQAAGISVLRITEEKPSALETALRQAVGSAIGNK